MNVFRPFGLLPNAWRAGRFDWNPEGDSEREAELRSAEAVVRFAERAAGTFGDFLLERGGELEHGDPRVETPRGEVAFSALVDFQRWHAAYHYRQLVEFLRAEGAPPEDVFPLDRLVGLALPADVY